jgi:multidrug efflux pump
VGDRHHHHAGWHLRHSLAARRGVSRRGATAGVDQHFIPGCNADVVERTVIQVIEQQLTGIDNLMFFSSSSSNGGGGITLFFKAGTDPDTAAMQTQNRVTLAEPRLPREVVLQGSAGGEGELGFLMAVSLRSKDNSVPSDVLNNVVAAQVLDPIFAYSRRRPDAAGLAPSIRCASG